MTSIQPLRMAGAGVVLALVSPVWANDAGSLDALMEIKGDADWGAYLSSECTACHGAGGGRIPPISGLTRTYLLTALHDYKTGFRKNATMENIAKALTDEEMAALAAYFETADR